MDNAISRADFDVIFGKEAELTKFRQLSQPHSYAANETVTLITSKDELKNVRILGPLKKRTQIEISKTDAYYLGIPALVRESGNIDGTPGLTIIGPKGSGNEWLVVFCNDCILNNTGTETIKLYDDFNNLIDFYTYSGKQQENKSFVRYPDGSEKWYDPIPTPGYSNVNVSLHCYTLE